MSASVEILGIALITVSVSLGVFAQDTAPEERIVPPPAGLSAVDIEPPAEEVRPDTRPLTGILPLTLGSVGTERSFLAPSFRFSQSMDSNPDIVSGQSNPLAVTNLTANAVLQNLWRGSEFSLNYTGGGSVYAGHSELNDFFQIAQIQQLFKFRRWSLTLGDNVSYTPLSPFGYGGVEDRGLNLAPGIVPNQTIFTSLSNQLDNVAIAQADYRLDSRSSFTVSGNFGILRSPGGSLLDSNQGGGQVGYNYSLTSRDFLGISYGINLIRYRQPLTGNNVGSHNIGLSYGRKVTGHLAFQARCGPQINKIVDGAVGSVQQAAWAAESGLTYQFRTARLNLSYWHDVGAGAGVIGAVSTHAAEGAFTTRLTRTVSEAFSVGYAHNSGLQGLSNSASGVFNTEFASTSLHRVVGQQATVFLSYSFYHQSTNVLACSLGLCGGDLNRHIFGMGFDWHMQPLLIH